MIEFPTPKGLEIPEGTEVGSTFDVMATLQLGEEGELYLKALDGNPVESEEDDGPEEDNAEGGFLDAVERRAASEEKMD